MGKENVHEHHRERMRKDFLRDGFKRWHEHNVLEYILHYAIPRVDTNGIAHELINTCGGFADVFRAPAEVLTSVDGVGEKTVSFLRMLGEFVKYYNGVRFEAHRREMSSEMCINYLLNLFDGKRREHFCIICLDACKRIVYHELIFEGSFETMDVDMMKLVRTVVQYDTPYMVISHNHPSGIAEPSGLDVTTTHCIQTALRYVGVEILDHIIVADGKYYSMRDKGDLLPPEDCIE